MNYTITEKQIGATLFMFWLGSLAIIGVSEEAKQDSWIAILLSGILFLPILFLYVRLTTLYPGKNLYEILLAVFGNIFGRMIVLIYVLFSIQLGALSLKIFSTFIHILNMPETPEPAILFFIILLVSWTVKSGPECIGRISKYTSPILVFFILVTLVFSIKDMDFSNLKPIMNTDMTTLLSCSFSVCMLPFGEAIVCLSFLSAVDHKAKLRKVFFRGLIWALAIILTVNLRNITVLGFPSATMFYFPSYEAASIISVGEFLSRIEVLIGINLMLAGFIKMDVCVYSASLGLTKLLNAEDQKPFVVPCGLLVLTFSEMLYENTLELMNWIKIFKIYAIPFQILLPVAVLIGAEIRTRAERSKTKNPPAPKKESEGS